MKPEQQELDFRLPDFYFGTDPNRSCTICGKGICLNNFARASHLAKHVTEGKLVYKHGSGRRSARYALSIV